MNSTFETISYINSILTLSQTMTFCLIVLCISKLTNIPIYPVLLLIHIVFYYYCSQ